MLPFASDLDEDLEQPEETEAKERFCVPCTAAREVVVPPLDVDAVFGPKGLIAAKNPRYEARPGQVRLSKAIASALVNGHHFMGEGPCGIGKSKAYGVPAAHLARHGKKVLIVTASIALQEQLVETDLPALRAELGWDFTVGVMKGKSNYVCVDQLDNLGDGIPGDLSNEDRRAYQLVHAWALTSKRGDKSELSIKPPDSVWSKFTMPTGDCPGKRCSEYIRCHSKIARDKAAEADILVTNYHMFFLNMAYGGTLLPASEVVILDEAHEAADIARDVLGFQIGAGAFKKFPTFAERKGNGTIAKMIREGVNEFFHTLLRFHDSDQYKSLLRWPAPFGAEKLVDGLEAFAATFAKSPLADAAINRAQAIKSALALEDENLVYSIQVTERPNGFGPPTRRAALRAQYVSPGPALSSMLWDSYKSVVAVSATITTDGRFDFARRELGAPSGISELVVETPFAFDRQALLVVPPTSELPEPNDERFPRVAAKKLVEAIEASDGRTLALFTSYRALHLAYEAVVSAVAKWPVEKRPRIMRQGEAPTQLLIRDFKLDHRSVLLGVTSLWTGIDVQGQALTTVVIDKLPFGSPDDPVTIRLSESDPQSFANYMVPKSILLLRQGVGRLIRSTSDVGAVVLLDKRLVTKSYGSRFLRSLPTMRRGTSAAHIRTFLAAHGVASAEGVAP
jgi:ATP-dependent DNA helicase DinG